MITRGFWVWGMRQSSNCFYQAPISRAATSPCFFPKGETVAPADVFARFLRAKIKLVFCDGQVSGAHVRITLFRAASLVGRSVRLYTRLCIAHLVVNSVTVESPRNERCHRHAQRGARLPRGRHRGQDFREAASPRFRPARCRAPAHAQRRQGCRLQRGTFRGARAIPSRSRSGPDRGRVDRERATPARRLRTSDRRFPQSTRPRARVRRHVFPRSSEADPRVPPPLPPPRPEPLVSTRRTRP